MENAILKQDAAGNWAVLDKRSGKFLPLPGANAMKSSPLPLDKDIDLTKPIAEQVFDLDSSDIRRRLAKG